MNSNNIKLSDSAKNALKTMKKDFEYSTYSNVIDDVFAFFQRNKITPKESIDNNFFTVLSLLKSELTNQIINVFDFVKKDSQSLRKLIRAIEKDHLVSISTKINYLVNEYKENEIKNNAESFIKNIDDSQNNSENSVSNLEKLETQLQVEKKTNNELNNKISSLDTQLQSMKDSLTSIYEKHRLEKSSFGGKSKIYLDMKREDFEKLFDILRNKD